MLALILALALIASLSCSAAGLHCFTCTNADCSTTELEPCFAETKCITASILVTSGGVLQRPRSFRACASPQLCPTTSPQTFSFNLGSVSAVASAECCDTDNCNGEPVPLPHLEASNDLQCYTCDAATPNCTTVLQCKGEQDQCFEATVTVGTSARTVMGCASTNLCAASGTSPFLNVVGDISGGPTCCGIPVTAQSDRNSTNNSGPGCLRLGLMPLLLGLLTHSFK